MAAALLIVACVLDAAVVAADTDQSPRIDVRVHGGALTVDLWHARLDEVLHAIAERAGFTALLQGDLGTVITRSFAGVPLEDGLRRLTSGHALAVTYAGAADDPGASTITEIRVLAGSARRGADAPVHPAAGPPIHVVVGGADRTPPAPRPRAEVPPDLARSREEAISAIQTLTDDAERGGDAAVARLGELLSDADTVVRQHAVAALARLGGAGIEPLLVSALADPDATVRTRAVRGLRRLPTESAAHSLAQVLARDADREVRLAAVRALASRPGPAMMQGLRSASADSDETVREFAARQLAWWKARGSAGE